MRKTNIQLNVILVGSSSPLPGGVSSSIRSIKSAIESNNEINLRVMDWYELWKIVFIRPNVIHFNFSKPTKRLIGTLLGRLIGSRVVHTIHGNEFNFRLLGNYFAAKFSHGFILLNKEILERFMAYGIKNIVKLTPILSNTKEIHNNNYINLYKVPQEQKNALVYTNGRKLINGKDVYGFLFISKLLPEFSKRNYNVIFLDPLASYSLDEIDTLRTGIAIHISENIDFKALLHSITVYLRPTSTDGNSVAVLEALDAGIPVLASDAVPRAEGVLTYRFGDAEDLIAKIDLLDNRENNGYEEPRFYLSSVEDYISFLKKL